MLIPRKFRRNLLFVQDYMFFQVFVDDIVLQLVYFLLDELHVFPVQQVTIHYRLILLFVLVYFWTVVEILGLRFVQNVRYYFEDCHTLLLFGP